MHILTGHPTRTRWLTTLAVAALFTSACGDVDDEGASTTNDGFVDPGGGNPDGVMDDAPDLDTSPSNNDSDDPSEVDNNDAQSDPCAIKLYERLDGVFSGTLTTTTSGPGFPEQTGESDISIDVDAGDGSASETPNCETTVESDRCVVEPGSVVTVSCLSNDIRSESVNEYVEVTNTPETFGLLIEGTSTSSQDGALLSQVTFEQTFSIDYVDDDTLLYNFTMVTQTDAGPTTSTGTGTLRKR